MYANPELELFVGLVPDAERLDVLQQLERHAGDLARVFGAVADGQAGHNHVGITNCLDLTVFIALSKWPCSRELFK